MEMDTLLNALKKAALIGGFFFLILTPRQATAQPRMSFSQLSTQTATYEEKAMPAVRQLYHHYKPQMEAQMNHVIGHTLEPMRSHEPESRLSNLVADALLYTARKTFPHHPADFAITNFGGIRTGLPLGDVRLYDIYSLFPFENAMVLVALKGKEVARLFTFIAKSRPQVVSHGISVTLDYGTGFKDLLINGEPLDVNKTYYVATSDFNLGGGGGGGMTMLANNLGAEYSTVLIRDCILDYITTLTQAGQPITAEVEGRIKIINDTPQP